MTRPMNLVLTISLLGVSLISPTLADDFKAKIDPLAQPLIDDGAVVGMVVGIVVGDDVEILTYGETEKGSKTAPTADSLYEIGSISKVFTGVLLADAARRGEVKLDQPLQSYLPDEVKVPVEGDAKITLRHLATHTSGLPRMPENFNPADPANPYADYDRKLLHAFLTSHKLRREPGTYEYSNYGAGLLGDVLAQNAETTYEELLKKRILDPLKMSSTSVALNDAQKKRFVPAYNAALKEEKPWEFGALAGAGGIRSSCSDMIKFIQANLADDKQAVNLALRDAHEIQDVPAEGQKMAIGWHIAGDGITRWHNGMTSGYHGWLSIIPSRNIGVVVLANTATAKVSTLGQQVTRVAFGVDVKPQVARKEIEVDAETLKRYEGTYAITPQFALTVTLEEGNLMVQATGQPKAQVFAESKTKFFYKIVDAQITFVANDDGAIEKLVLHQFGRDIEGVRK